MMEEEFEKEEGGVTLGYIFRTIFSQKWLALIIAAVITIAGTLGLHFIGKRNEVYSVSFVLQLPNTSGTNTTTTSYTYPDGTSFYFTDLISAKNLKEVASRDDFKGVEVDKMVKAGDISITREVDSVVDNSQNGEYDLNYTIKVKAKYFDDEDVARDFIDALISIPRQHILSMNIDYDQSLTASKLTVTYEEQLTLLKNQAVYIQSKYDELIEAYGKEVVVKDGKTLSYYQTQLLPLIGSSDKDDGNIDILKNKAIVNSYLMYDENGQPLEAALSKYESEKIKKEREKTIMENALQVALSKFEDTSVILDTNEIFKYTEQIAQLTQEITEIDAFLSKKVVDKNFEKEVSAVESEVERLTKEFGEIASNVYTTKTTVNYLNASVIEVEGGRGLLMSVGLSLVAGILLAAIVAYIVGWSKQKKAGATQSAAVRPQNEAQLQAAATDADEKKDEK